LLQYRTQTVRFFLNRLAILQYCNHVLAYYAIYIHDIVRPAMRIQVNITNRQVFGERVEYLRIKLRFKEHEIRCTDESGRTKKKASR